MAGTRFEMAPGWQDALRAAERTFFQTTLGPAILADMQGATPVLSGRLEASEDFQVTSDELPELRVGTYPDDDGPVDYWAAVEFGFHGEEEVREYVTRTGAVVRAHTRMGNSPEQSYMRVALYRVRTP